MTEVKVEADAIESSEIKKCKEGTPLSSKGTKAENKSKMVDWPLREIKEPHDNDVLYGRGGGTNHHPGNKRYRKMVEDRKINYVNSKRLDKPLVALEIIREWRGQDPPGRFLKLDERTGLWHDVGDKKAREKTSQALREKAPLIRKQLEEENDVNSGSELEGESDEDGEVIKSTRFAADTNYEGANDVTKAVLARDHSLGREYLESGEAVTLEGFSWQDGLKTPAEDPIRMSSYGSVGSIGGSRPVPHFANFPYGSHGSLPPPPGPYQHPRHSNGDPHMRYPSHTRYESWSSLPPGPPPPLPPGYIVPYPDHSLGQFPLPYASASHPAYNGFEATRNGSGHWQYPPQEGPLFHYSGGPPPNPNYPPPNPNYPPPSASFEAGIGSPPPTATTSPRQTSNKASPPYDIDPAVASAWSGQDQDVIVKTMSAEEFGNSSSSPDRSRDTSKPDIVKRATSNQNETIETKPDIVGESVKRAALNRDNSYASNRLKELTFPGQFKNGRFDATKEVNELSDDMLKSSLHSPVSFAPVERESTFDQLPPMYLDESPKRLSKDDRTATIDMIAMDLMVKPLALSGASRSSTIEALALDFDESDLLVKPGLVSRTTTMEAVFQELRGDFTKPSTLTALDRMTTKDMMDLVNEPIPDDGPDFAAGKRQVV